MRSIASLFLLLFVCSAAAATLPPGAENWPAECDGGQAKSCLFHGFRLMNGDGIEKNADRATWFFSKACKLEMLDGCYHAGYNLYYGVGNVRQDLKSSIAYLAAACRGGFYNKQVCYYTANALLHAPGMEPRPKEAMYFADKGCRESDGEACGIAGYLRSGNMGVERRSADARVYSEAGCKLESAYACYNAAFLLSYAEDIEHDPARAVAYAEKAWQLKQDVRYAYLAGMIHVQDKDYAEANPFFSKACEGGMADACLGMGNNIRHTGGELAKARGWYRKACDKKLQAACQAIKDLDQYEKELRDYKRKVAEYEAQNARYKAGEAKVTAALDAGDYNGAMEIATYGMGSARQSARVLMAAENAGKTGSLAPVYFYGTSNWFISAYPMADGIVKRELAKIRAAEKASQRSYRVAPVNNDPKVPSSLYDQAMKFQRDSYRKNLNWYNRGGRPSDPRVYD